jgi:hypothetical protein
VSRGRGGHGDSPADGEKRANPEETAGHPTDEP